MRKSILISLIITCFTLQIKAQCPTASFSLPDTACGGAPVLISNNSTGTNPLTYNWDFNTGDADNAPAGITVANYAATLTSSRGMDLVEDSGNYYAVAITVNGILSVMSFGNSLDNVPAVTNLGTLSVLVGGDDIVVKKEQNDWYAFASDVPSGNIYKIYFGNSLLNTPTATALFMGNVGPAAIALASSQGNEFVLVTDYFTNNVSVLNFGNTYQNTTYTVSNIPVGTNPLGISVIKKCDNWYCYIGYLSSNDVSIIDFGQTISGTPNNYISTAFSISYLPRKFISLEDGGNYYLFLTSFNKDAITRINLGPNPVNTSPVIVDLGSFGIYTSHTANIIRKFGSLIIGFAGNYGTGDLIKYTFPETNGYQISSSTDSLPTPVFQSPGMYHVSLTVYDSLTATSGIYTDSIFIQPSPNPGFLTAHACLGDPVLLIDTTTTLLPAIINQQWDFGDTNSGTGDTVTHIYNNPGNYQVSLTEINTLGCSKTSKDTISINAIPVAGFSFLDQQCAKLPLLFSDTSTVLNGTIQSWHWDFGNGDTSIVSSPTYSYPNGGNYIIKLIAVSNSGCIDSTTQNIGVLYNPNSAFTVNNTCLNEQTQFTNQSVFGGTGTITSNWDLGDNNTSNATSPSHTYASTTGNYLVTLISQSQNGCSDTLSKNVRIGNQPIPYFKLNLDTACAGNSIVITDSSYVAFGDTITNHFWDFGDNTYDSTSVNPTHSYAVPGNYIIKLTVVSPTYCDSSVTHSVYVIQSPVALFSNTSECLGAGIPFQDLSTSPNGSSIVSWHWNFGDNDTSLTQNPSHNYINSGYYIVNLLITSSKGCFDTISHQVEVYDLPNIKFGIGKACTQTPVQFTDSSTVNAGVITGWSWNFGVTGGTSNIQNPNYTYANSLVYPVTLIATSSFGCIDSMTKYFIINPSPQFNIVSNGNCINDSTKFICNLIVGNPSNMGFVWDFGNSNFSLIQNPEFYFSTPGQYPIVLTVENKFNSCEVTHLDTITVSPLPIASFLTDSACINTDLQLHDLSSVQSGSIQFWNWTLGNYGASAQQNPIINLPVPDSILVKLVVTSDAGCKDSVSHTVEINGLPTVKFTPSPLFGAPPLPVNFNNQSSAGTYIWNFGDNSSLSSAAQPLHIYSDTGTFNITLIATTAQGCTDSAKNTVLVLIPLLDLGIEAINFTKTGDLWQVSAKVRNNGNQVITEYALNVQLAGKSLVNELFDQDTLQPGAYKNITFNSRFAVDDNDNPGYLCVDIVEVNNRTDDNLTNNHKCITSGKTFEVFEVYPNPFNDQINIGINIPEEGITSIRIYDITGQLIEKPSELNYLQGYNTISIPLQHIEAGMYFIELSYGDIKKVIRIEKY